MASVVIRKIPEIVLIDKSELGTMEIFTLNMLYKTDTSEFVICPHQRETIYLNKSFEQVNKLIPLINKFMEQKYCGSKADKLYEEFKDIAGEQAAGICNAIWQDWRKERIKADAKEKAEEALSKARKRHIRQCVKKRGNVIQAVFDIGFGVYEKNTKADFKKGAENAFVYGYLCALKDMEK